MKILVSLLILGLLAFVALPYYQVWRLEQAAVRNDRSALRELVDIRAVREQIKRRLNKDVHSAVGDVSNAFVDWLQDGIQRLGGDAVERLVTLDWVRQQLLSKAGPPRPAGFVEQISYAFFDSPDSFMIRIGELGQDPVHLRMSLQGAAWRVTAVYN